MPRYQAAAQARHPEAPGVGTSVIQRIKAEVAGEMAPER
jgi:hypothetical protein